MWHVPDFSVAAEVKQGTLLLEALTAAEIE
ncbi:MAG: hypothetical protein ACI88H_002044 [Cocleimonas sp.]|jgi:hypothetical protein